MDLVGKISASRIFTRDYWRWTALFFLIFFALFFLTDLVLEHWTHILGTHTVSGSFWYSLFMGAWFAFLFPPMTRAIRVWRAKQ